LNVVDAFPNVLAMGHVIERRQRETVQFFAFVDCPALKGCVYLSCDRQGAERKTRDEERRAAKRKLAATGRNKRLDELYHAVCERSEFYAMADLVKMPALFTPNDHNDKVKLKLQFFWGSARTFYANEGLTFVQLDHLVGQRATGKVRGPNTSEIDESATKLIVER
jgi:hypothetical protein